MIVTPILIVTVRKYAKRLKRSGKQRQEALDSLNSKLQETLSGIRVIRAFATEKHEINDFKKKNINLKKIAVKSARYNAKANSIMEAMNYIIIALLLMFSGYRVLRAKNFTPGDFITIVGAISSMYTPARRAMTRFNSISANISSITRVSEILDNFSKVGKTLVVSTHDTDFAYEFADYIYVLDKGKIVRQGSRDEVFEDFEFLKKLNLNVPNILKIKSYLKYKNLDENDYCKFLEEKNLL